MKEIQIEQKNNQQELSLDEKIEHKQAFVKQLIGTVSKIDLFTSNLTDEFRIERETGNVEGIFKCWAVPIVPFLEIDMLDLFSEAMNKDGPFWDRFTKTEIESVDKWTKDLSDHPARLWETLEKWRGFSEVQDRRLDTIFKNKPLPKDGDELVAELYLRLVTAFGLASPFYNIEAMVGGAIEKSNPIIFNKTDTTDKGGALDLVAMALPSALANKIKSANLNWNDLNWNEISKNSKLETHDPESITAFKVSHTLGVPIEDVVFAANALQFIPTNVGGKKGDIDPKEARKIIDNVLNTRKISQSGTVGRDMNALIRFLNWFPLSKSNDNFSGVSWRYSAVCDTTDQLFKAFFDQKPLASEFQKVFEGSLADQLHHLDASSARGRFLIQLFNEGKVRPEILNLIGLRSKAFFEQISSSLVSLELNEQTADALEMHPRFLVGGKAAGLAEGAAIFGKESIPKSVVITTETIEDWLKSDSQLWKLIIRLNNTNNINEKLDLSSEISTSIKQKSFEVSQIVDKITGSNLLAVRSSSFDEDTDFNGTAAGIYESQVPVGRNGLGHAVANVVASFFSEKAVSYRNMQRLSDIPMFAVIISPFIEGIGGVAFSAGNNNGWEIVVSENPSDVASGINGNFDSFKFNDGIMKKVINKGWVNEGTINQIGDMIQLAETVLKHRVDIEFVVDKNNKLWILQLREIKDGNKSEKILNPSLLNDFKLNRLEDLGDLDKSGISDNTRLFLDEHINIDQFQGTLFRWLTINRESIKEIVLPKRIARTSHFANICINLGINLVFADNE